MEKEEVKSKVNEFLIREMEIDEDTITENARLRQELGLDSLDFIDIVVIVEKTFGFKIKPEEMAGILTVGQFYDFISSRVKS
jgi:acyl carrier protein